MKNLTDEIYTMISAICDAQKWQPRYVSRIVRRPITGLSTALIAICKPEYENNGIKQNARIS